MSHQKLLVKSDLPEVDQRLRQLQEESLAVVGHFPSVY